MNKINAKSALKSFFERHAAQVAEALIGGELLVDGAGGVIVETEAYTSDDPASHSFKGDTDRNAAMYGSPGTAYVYRSYGIHWCLNFVCLPGSAVLIRAIEPSAGLQAMKRRRGTENVLLLCAGPGRLCKALAVDGGLNGRILAEFPFQITLPNKPAITAVCTRVGISKATDRPWRFGLKGSRFLSKKF